MHNIYINQQTSLSGRAQKISLEDAPEIQTRETPEYLFLLKDAGGKLQKALNAMQPEYRYVLLLCDSEELSYSEIADILQCPVGTVRSRLSRAREIIKCAVYDEEEV
jgi:RNA polymerase sigma-70 factor (ECF subfamily)